MEKIKERFNFKVCPHEKAIIEDTALEVCNVTIEQISEYPNMKTIYNELVKMLSKYCDVQQGRQIYLVGYNINAFDNSF